MSEVGARDEVIFILLGSQGHLASLKVIMVYGSAGFHIC